MQSPPSGTFSNSSRILRSHSRAARFHRSPYADARILSRDTLRHDAERSGELRCSAYAEAVKVLEEAPG
jgi:hypothetical protein